MEDVNASHNDDLVMQAKIANYEVKRVFVDSGISVNVIFQRPLIR